MRDCQGIGGHRVTLADYIGTFWFLECTEDWPESGVMMIRVDSV